MSNSRRSSCIVDVISKVVGRVQECLNPLGWFLLIPRVISRGLLVLCQVLARLSERLSALTIAQLRRLPPWARWLPLRWRPSPRRASHACVERYVLIRFLVLALFWGILYWRWNPFSWSSRFVLLQPYFWAIVFLVDMTTKTIEVIFQLYEDKEGVNFSRSAVLALVNMFTVTLAYGIIYYTLSGEQKVRFYKESVLSCQDRFDPITAGDALYLSWATMFASDSGIKPCTWGAKVSIGTQQFVWFLLVVVFLALVVNNLTQERRVTR